MNQSPPTPIWDWIVAGLWGIHVFGWVLGGVIAGAIAGALILDYWRHR